MSAAVGKVSVGSSTPKVDVAPRVEGSNTSLRFEFRSIDDLVTCLEAGTFVLDLSVKDDKFEQEGKLTLFLKGRYSDYGFGAIYCALKKETLVEKHNPGSTSSILQYDLLENTARNFASRKATEDTQEAYTKVMKFLEEPMSAIRAKYYPGHSESLHIPKFLKFKMPKNAASKRYSKTEGSEEVGGEEFNMVQLIQSEGKLMARLNMPWFMEQKNLQNIMMGVSLSLARWKYLTDDERVQIAAKKAAKAKEDELIQESKRKREEKKQAAAAGSSSSSAKRVKIVAPAEADEMDDEEQV